MRTLYPARLQPPRRVANPVVMTTVIGGVAAAGLIAAALAWRARRSRAQLPEEFVPESATTPERVPVQPKTKPATDTMVRPPSEPEVLDTPETNWFESFFELWKDVPPSPQPTPKPTPTPVPSGPQCTGDGLKIGQVYEDDLGTFFFVSVERDRVILRPDVPTDIEIIWSPVHNAFEIVRVTGAYLLAGKFYPALMLPFATPSAIAALVASVGYSVIPSTLRLTLTDGKVFHSVISPLGFTLEKSIVPTIRCSGSTRSVR